MAAQSVLTHRPGQRPRRLTEPSSPLVAKMKVLSDPAASGQPAKGACPRTRPNRYLESRHRQNAALSSVGVYDGRVDYFWRGAVGRIGRGGDAVQDDII